MENKEDETEELRLELGTITRLVVGGRTNKGDINPICELNDTVYKQYTEAAMRLFHFSGDQQIFMIAHSNYSDYQNLLLQYFKEYIEETPMDYPRVDNMILNVNRYMLNYLSAVRTYLDHSETNLKKCYGRKSQRFLRFKSACSDAYDEHFPYRFLYELRNYAQHCGMPISALELHTESAPNSKGIHHALRALINRDELLENFDSWKASLKKEILRLPPKFDVNPYVADMMKCLRRINFILLEDDLPELTRSATYIKQIENLTKNMPGIPCIIKSKKDFSPKEGGPIEIEMIPVHLADVVTNINTKKTEKRLK